MNHFSKRFETFQKKKCPFKVMGTEMAKAGFYYIGSRCCRCYYCSKELDGWEEDDIPWDEHKKHAGYCPFINKYVAPPEPHAFTILEAMELERDRMLLLVSQNYDRALKEIEATATKSATNFGKPSRRRKR